MKIDFNNLRILSILAYSNSVDILNEYMSKANRKMDGQDLESLKEELLHLRTILIAMAMCYQDNDPDFTSVMEDISANIPVFEF